MPTDPADDPMALAAAAAAALGGAWQLDVDEVPLEDPPAEAAPPSPPPPDALAPAPLPTPAPFAHNPPAAEVPPSPEQIVEALLFVGGHPLTAAVACGAVRGLTADRFDEAVGRLNRRYRDQGRPYTIEPRDGGFVLAARAAHRALRERLLGGPREARLGQPALDVLAVVAYRQPVGKGEIDAVRGTDSGPPLRQLVRLGLVAVRHRADADGREVRYGTTPRFLQVFGLTALDELPRLGDAQPV